MGNADEDPLNTAKIKLLRKLILNRSVIATVVAAEE